MRRHFGTVIVGGGPAGLAPLVSASRDGRLDDLLAGGVAIIEAGPTIGSGRLGRYAINSDSTAETFLAAVRDHVDPRLGRIADDPLGQVFAAAGRNAVPLAQAGDLMAAVGAVLARAVTDAGGRVWTGHEALAAEQAPDRTWRVRMRELPGGDSFEITAEHLLLATGAHQSLDRLRHEPVAGRPLLPAYADTLILSDAALQPAGLAAVRRRLSGRTAPRVAVVGGSTSALAVAGALLRDCGAELATPGSVTVFHRRPLRVFYPSVEAAQADCYDVFGVDDVCPLSGFVFRLAGFRLDSRELLMRVLGLGGRPPEPRLALRDLTAHDPEDTHRRLAAADIVVAALGYRPRALPVFDSEGGEIPLRGRLSRDPMVDRSCRICDIFGQPVPNLFGIGLAAGFVPHGALGGEPSFRGQANGLWLWQTAVGAMLVDSFLAPAPATSAIRDDALRASIPALSATAH